VLRDFLPFARLTPVSNVSFIHRLSESGNIYSAVGDRYRLLASGKETSGAYCLLEATVPPGGGPPPHYHTREEESFYVIDGEITFTVDGKTIVGKPGTFVQIPRTVPHAFKNNSDQPVQMLIQCVPAGFDEFLLEIATELPSADSPPIPPTEADIAKLLETAPKYGIHIVPPPEH